MRKWKNAFLLLFSFLLILFTAGCQKDEVVPHSNNDHHNAAAVQSSSDKTSSDGKEKEIKTSKEDHNQNKDQTADAEKPSHSAADSSKTSNAKETKSKSTDSAAKSKNGSSNANVEKENSKGNSEQKSTAEKSNATTIHTPQAPKSQSTVKPEPAKKPSSKPVATPVPKPAPKSTSKPVNKQTVTVSIRGDSQTGTILSPTKVPLQNGDTALEVTLRIAKQKGIPVSIRGSHSTAYVEGISNLYEFDHGPLSGWTIKVNNKYVSRSAGAVAVKAGDVIQWIYTNDYTKDTQP